MWLLSTNFYGNIGTYYCDSFNLVFVVIYKKKTIGLDKEVTTRILPNW